MRCVGVYGRGFVGNGPPSDALSGKGLRCRYCYD